MRRWAFVVMIVGMFVLVLLLGFGGIEVGDLEGLEVNTLVRVSGEVV